MWRPFIWAERHCCIDQFVAFRRVLNKRKRMQHRIFIFNRKNCLACCNCVHQSGVSNVMDRPIKHRINSFNEEFSLVPASPGRLRNLVYFILTLKPIKCLYRRYSSSYTHLSIIILVSKYLYKYLFISFI